MGTHGKGAGGVLIKRAFESLGAYAIAIGASDANVAEVRAAVNQAAREEIERIREELIAGTGPIAVADKHTLQWMKFGVDGGWDAIKAHYNQTRKQYGLYRGTPEKARYLRGYRKRKKDGGGGGSNQSMESRKRFVLSMIGVLNGPRPYSRNKFSAAGGRFNPRRRAFYALNHSFKNAIHVQNSGSTGFSNRGDSIWKYAKVVANEKNMTYSIQFTGKEATIYDWITSGTTKMVPRKQPQPRFSTEVRKNFVKRATELIEKRLAGER